MSSFSEPRSPRLAGIEGLRALAAIAVLIFHCWMYGDPRGGSVPLGLVSAHVMPHFALGVTLFFTLSGFLLYRPFAAAVLLRADRPSLVEYLRNRALRILPAYWFILLIVAIGLGAANLPNTAPGLRVGSLADQPILLARAIALLQSYSPTTLYLGIGPAWSLSVEVVFYLALPMLVLPVSAIGARCPGRSARWIALLAPPLLLLGVGLSGKCFAALLAGGVHHAGGDVSWRDVVRHSFWGQADLFSSGMVVAIVFSDLQQAHRCIGRSGRRALAAGAALVGGAAVALSYGKGFGPYAYDTLTSVAAALLLALVVLPTRERRSRFVRVLDYRPVIGLGLVSYSLFLWHEPLLHFLRAHELTFAGPTGFLVNVVVVAALGFAVSVVTYRFVERPALRRKRRSASGSTAIMPMDQIEAAP